MSLVSELNRRNVLRVGAAYVVAAWLLIQVAETIFPLFGFDETPARIVVIVLAIGFIPTLVLSWVFEWTPEGFRRESDTGDRTLGTDKHLDRLIMAGLIVALTYFAIDKFVLEPRREAAEQLAQAEQLAIATEEARKEGRTEALLESYGDQSIAVLPFADMSPMGDQEYFSDGIAEEVLNLLAQVPEMRVISRSSSFAFNGQALEVPEIAKRLKVGHVLEGSVRKAGNTVRITAQLIDAHSDTHLWSQTWDRELTNILAIQDEIAAAVVESLQSVLIGPILSASTQQMSDAELEAFELVLKGRYLLNQANADAYRRALPLYERAIEVAPDYAPAHAGLAKVLRQMKSYGVIEPEAANPRIEAALDRALELDPEDSDALATRGAVLGLVRVEPDVQAARNYWRRAVAVNPNNGDALRWLGWSYVNEDPVRFLEYVERAYSVAPTNALVSMWQAIALAKFDRFDEILELLGDWHALDPDNTWPFHVAGDVFYQTRRLELALKSYYQVFRMAPQQVDDEINGVVWLFVDGLSMPSTELAMRWAELRVANNPESGNGNFQRIVLTWLSGRDEEAARLFDELHERHPEWRIVPARLHLIFTRDYRRSRELWEAGGISEQNLESWKALFALEYAFVLQQTGDPDRARVVIDSTLARIGEQMAAGAINEDWWELNFYAGLTYVLLGDNEKALDYLRRDAANRGLSSVAALKIWPEFDPLRDNPEFQKLIAEQEEINAQWRERLEEEGLLLTPEEVLALEDFDFDSFAEP